MAPERGQGGTTKGKDHVHVNYEDAATWKSVKKLVAEIEGIQEWQTLLWWDIKPKSMGTAVLSQ